MTSENTEITLQFYAEVCRTVIKINTARCGILHWQAFAAAV